LQKDVEPLLALENLGNKRYDIFSGGGGAVQYDNKFVIYDRDNNQPRIVIMPNGEIGIGATDPREQLEVGGNIIFNGVKLTHVTGSSPSCPSGSNFLMRKFVGITCQNPICSSSCTIPGGWGFIGECDYAIGTGRICTPVVCSSTWTEAVCLGNA